MLKIQELKALKREKGYTNEMLAELSGVPLGTVQKVLGGTTKAPRRETLMKLEHALTSAGSALLRESPFAYDAGAEGKQGNYTLEDYYNMPDEHRVELIDGVIYDMTAPSIVHQFVTGAVFNQIFNVFMEHDGNCLPILSPIDVQLDGDEQTDEREMRKQTVVQPDLIILCDPRKNAGGRICGAPDFVMEVVSPGSRRRDMVIKLNKYMNAGVREYWIADPYEERVIVYDFSGEDFPRYYAFDDSVPVMISGGELCVDFRRIKEKKDRFFPSE